MSASFVGNHQSIFMVVFGTFNVSFSYMFGTVCRLFIGSLDGICFKFPGWEDIQCGIDFQDFCEEWERGVLLVTLWGGFIVVVGKFIYFDVARRCR